MPLGQTIEHEEVYHLKQFCAYLTALCLTTHFYSFALQMLEVVRLEGHSLIHEDAFSSRDVHLLQVL